MKMTAQQIMDAYLTLRRIANEGRAMPQKGKYRVARMLSKLQPDAQPILEQYDAMIMTYGHKEPDAPGNSVPPDKLPEFLAKWKAEVGGEEHDVDIEPIPLDQLDVGGPNGSIHANEFLALADLVRE